jgi:sec-independent protein translocase protein TatB
MDFLGVGPLELIVILIIALIVVGPERLPQLAQSIGKTLRDLRAMSEGLTNEWQREISSISDIDTGEGLKEALTQPFQQVQAEVQQALSAPLASPSSTAAEAVSPPSSPPEQLETPNDDVDHANT